MSKHTTLLLALIVAAASAIEAKDYYVSASRGKGKSGSKAKPTKDMGNIIGKLEPGDTVHIAGGTYLGRGKSGADLITVPVSVIGGYDDTFTSRDPWGKHPTVLSGSNTSKNWVAAPRLMLDLSKYRGKEMPAIRIDGLIVDNAGRNRYKTDRQLAIVRMANPKSGQMPTPDQGGLVIRLSKTGNYTDTWTLTVQNCIVTNTAPTQGALSVSGYKGSKITIRNNAVVNNTGTGIMVASAYIARDDKDRPQFLIENNTVLFTWKYDPMAQSFSGNSINFSANTASIARSNVFAFADRFGVNNAAKASVLLKDNLILGNVDSDYLEFDTRIALDDIEDEAEYLHEDTGGNEATRIKVPVSNAWAKHYGSRVLIDRDALEADIKAQKTRANEIRSMLGLPLRAGHVDGPSSPVWLNRLSLTDAIRVASQKHNGRYGSGVPYAK